ncbi:MAG: hypothetical protein GF388_11180 [Candidatus Aegiribacteria sp.]|nr:hypothetical protein [Candidatus Aegiribacteria sp.]MBD3295558.1 hypothetical protein [Candidatus Fermentibacteria bacterium]
MNYYLKETLRRGFLVVMVVGIFYLSHQPSLKLVQPLFPHQDKVLHWMEYSLLLISIYINRDLLGRYRSLPFIFSLGAIYAVSDEIHQSFVPGRDCSLGDLAADIAGLATGVALCVFLLRRKSGVH